MKRNSKGIKTEGPNIRTIPKSSFQQLPTIEDVVTRLFGEKPCECSQA